MKTISHPITRWGRLWITLFAVALTLAVLRSSGLATVESAPAPVWGRKPVLYYFTHTAGLAERLPAEVGLSAAQFERLRRLAQQEQDQLAALQLASQAVAADPALSQAEKQARLAASGYNQAVETILQTTQAELDTVLDEPATIQLVDWIEAQWLVERDLHGVPQNSPTSTDAARTFSIYATRYDSGGAYGVALPDKCVKFTNGGIELEECIGYVVGQTYSVRLTYNGKSTTAKGIESGPWNVNDTYWATVNDPTPRRKFTDLPLGMPEAQAAYFDGYNGGLDEFGRVVTAPYGIDLAREVSIDIGLDPGVNDWIDVTFLWTDGWDNPTSQVVTLNQPTKLQPAWDGDTCSSYWYPISGYNDKSAYLTLNVSTASYSTNSGEWAPDLPVAGTYKVEAYIPDHTAINWPCPATLITCDTSEARYTIQHANGSTTVTRDQCPLADQWLNLGSYEFERGTSGNVELSDLNGEPDWTRTVSFSAMRFSLLSAPTATPRPATATPTPTQTPTPTPTLTPTPTPTPAPFLWSGYGVAEPSMTITIPLGASYLQMPGLGEAVLEVQYDPAAVEALDCQADPDGAFDRAVCDPHYEHDGQAPDTLRLELSSSTGVYGFPRLADLIFGAWGAPGAFTWLQVTPITLTNPAGLPLAWPAGQGAICLEPCDGRVQYLPIIGR